MVHENSRPSESGPCLLCIARFDDGKQCTVQSAVTKRQSPEKVSPGVIFLLVCSRAPVRLLPVGVDSLMTRYCHG